MGPQRVSDEDRRLGAHFIEDRPEILLEGSREALSGAVRIPVTTEVEGDDVESLGEGRRQVPPPVGVGPRPVEQDEGWSAPISPAERVQLDAVQLRTRETSAVGRGSRARLQGRGA